MKTKEELETETAAVFETDTVKHVDQESEVSNLMTSNAIRIYSHAEEQYLDVACRGLLIKLEQADLITPELRENIIANVMANERQMSGIKEFIGLILQTMHIVDVPTATFLQVKESLMELSNEPIEH